MGLWDAGNGEVEVEGKTGECEGLEGVEAERAQLGSVPLDCGDDGVDSLGAEVGNLIFEIVLDALNGLGGIEVAVDGEG